MEKITSFTIDHIRLVPGVYVSRVDAVAGHPVTTFDLRMTSPNDEPVMNTAEMHTIEHLAATFLRNHEESTDIVPLMIEMFTFIRDFEGEVPGAAPKDCGNYLDMNLGMAKYLANKYLDEVLLHITDAQLNYPA